MEEGEEEDVDISDISLSQPHDSTYDPGASATDVSESCPHCLYNRKWDSQPIMGSTPVGNLQLSAAVYFSGGSYIKMEKSNEVGGSFYMEKEGLKSGLDLLEANSIEVDYIVTDRHTQDCLKSWRSCLKKGVPAYQKVVTSTEKSHLLGGIVFKNRTRESCKWTSLINHIQNVHTHDDREFPKCAHPDRVSKDPSKWFQPGTVALYKVEKLLVNKRVLGDVKKLSSDYQTSSLEAFHSVIIRFAPKSVVYPFVGMMCRLYLAGMHFNENVKRQQATSKGQALFKVAYPKYKKGKPMAKPVKTKPTYGKKPFSVILHI
ncbi:hypothetical protein WMY93_012186 [Mugilogobius chulae]|uniref:Uncharacterized protein n=1 Tax=Mugilogobius chulae TaxID=88201 RepID=A0AAW0P5Z8_9GOBI